MKVGIVGLGLIGGSMARAYKKADHTVYAIDTDQSMLDFAQLAGAVDQPLHRENIGNCQLILLCVYSGASIAWLRENADCVSKDAMVMDCCGIKEKVCKACFSIAQEYGFTFVGAHPMAGSHFSGFKYSRSTLFQGAPMVLVPPRYDDPEILEHIKELLAPCGFKIFSVTTAEEHDKMIAFTSQMPHILSNAFIKSPTALSHKGFSAGSYKDLTRVAWLNPQMWAELFLSNQENVLFELDCYVESLMQYRDAIAKGDEQTLIQLLDEGRKRKEEVDG